MRTRLPEHGGKKPKETTARVERLLRAASSWEPDAPAPDRLAERAMARLGVKEREGERVFATRRPTTWWGFGTIGVTAAAILFMWGKVSQETAILTAEATPSPVAPLAAPSPTPAAGATPGVRNNVTTPAYSATDAAAMKTRNAGGAAIGSGPKDRESRTTIRTRSDAARFAEAVWRPTHRRRRDGMHSGGNRLIAATDKHAAASVDGALRSAAGIRNKPTKSVWTEETVTRTDYRVLVPVVLTQSDGDDSGMTATPAVIEVAYDPHAAQMAGY